MGHTIPSFRQLLEIEKLDWPNFEKTLPTKKSKKHLIEFMKNLQSFPFNTRCKNNCSRAYNE